MAEEGWVKLHRCLLEKPIWTNSTPEQKAILITILLDVNRKEKEWEWRGERFKASPGQTITSLEKLAHKAGVSIQNVRTALKRFEKLEFLTNESTKTGRLITVINWGVYQAKSDDPNIAPNKDLTDSQQTPNKDLTPNKKDKKDKKDKNIFSPDGIEYRLSNYLFQHMKRNNPTCKEPDFQKWCKQMDYILRIDKRDSTEVKTIIEFCQKDSFWKTNILSVSKLREKYDQLNVKRLESRKDKPSSSSPATNVFEKTFEDDI